MKVKRSTNKLGGNKSYYCLSTIANKILHTLRQRLSILITSVGLLVLLTYAASLTTGHSLRTSGNRASPKKTIDTTRQSLQHTTSTAMKTTECNEAMHYKLVEEGTINTGDAFTKYAAYCGDEPISIQAWIDTMATTESASVSLTKVIQKSHYGAVYFETKGCTATSASMKAFEFVLVDAPELKSFAEPSPDPHAFEEHFAKSTADAAGVTFLNLSGSSKLISPTPSGCSGSDCGAYTHLAAFCRLAPPEQVAQVWQLAAREYKERLGGDTPVWFSTCGTGIAWLHLRLDYKPKYYTFNPFKSEL